MTPRSCYQIFFDYDHNRTLSKEDWETICRSMFYPFARGEEWKFREEIAVGPATDDLKISDSAEKGFLKDAALTCWRILTEEKSKDSKPIYVSALDSTGKATTPEQQEKSFINYCKECIKRELSKSSPVEKLKKALYQKVKEIVSKKELLRKEPVPPLKEFKDALFAPTQHPEWLETDPYIGSVEVEDLNLPILRGDKSNFQFPLPSPEKPEGRLRKFLPA